MLDPISRDYSLALIDITRDEQIGQQFTVPFLPTAGLRINYDGGTWQVIEAEVSCDHAVPVADPFQDQPLLRKPWPVKVTVRPAV